MLAPWKKSYGQPRQHIKKQKHYFANKALSSQSYGFSSGHVWMWELDYKESWVPKNWCFWTVVMERTLESPLDCKEIQPVPPKGNQSWLFIGRTDAETEAPILWPPDVKNWHVWKTLMLGKIEGGRIRGQQRMRWLDGITDSVDMRLSNSRRWWWTGKPDVLHSMGLQRVGHDWATELNWTNVLRGVSEALEPVSVALRERRRVVWRGWGWEIRISSVISRSQGLRSEPWRDGVQAGAEGIFSWGCWWLEPLTAVGSEKCFPPKSAWILHGMCSLKASGEAVGLQLCWHRGSLLAETQIGPG